MANQLFKRAPGKGKFLYVGVDLVHPPDLMPQGKAPYLLNVTAARQQGALQARAGTTAINAALDQTNIHSLIRVNDQLPGASPAWNRFVGAGTKVYAGQSSFASVGTGYSGNPLSLVAQRPPNSPEPFLYVYDSSKQRKYSVPGTEYGIGVPAPPEPTIGQTAPIVKDLGQYTATTGWVASDAAGSLSTAQRVASGTTISSILYDVASTGWCSVLPSNTAFSSTPTVRPTTTLNGWAANAHVGAYEMGVDNAHGWGLNGVAAPYQNPGNVFDANNTTYASAIEQHTHTYCGCIWTFSGSTTTLGSVLNILSEVPVAGTDGLIITNRSAGIWYSTDGGTTWTQVYDSNTRAKGWDSISLPGGIAYNQIQVMAFMDAHDDMAHYVYEINLSGSSHNSAYSFGSRLVLNAETVTAKDLFSNLPSTTVQGVAYDSASVATVQPTLAIRGLTRNQIVTINSNKARVLDVTEGPDGSYSFRVKLAGIVAGQTIAFPVSFRTYTTGTHAAGESITSGLLTAQFTPTQDVSIGKISLPVTLDLTQAGSRPLTEEDYMHVSLRFTSPANVTEVHVMVDVDNTTNDFTGNYFYYVIRQNDFQQVSLGTQSTEDSLISAVSNQVAVTYNANTVPGQLPLGDSQYLEATFKLNDLIRAGTDQTVNLSAVKAIGIRAIITGSTTMQVGSWWVGGTYGPDANYNSNGNQGQPILYRYRYRSSTNGTISNPGPATRAGELPVRNGVTVAVTASTDTQIDLIDIERNGGTFDTWHQSLTVPNTTATVTDDVKETVAFASYPLDLLQYKPWPITDKPRTATCNIVGTRVTATSGTPFNTSWIPGVEIIIGNKTYTLLAPPESTTALTLAQNAGYQTSVTVRIPEATIAGQPLPYACLGPDGRVFATGDPYNPGLLYFSNPYSPDTASDQGYIEITNPSEPLGPPRYFEGAIYVRSTEATYRVDPTPGAPNPYAYYKLSSAPGVSSPWAITSTGDAYLGPDGIYVFNGTGAENITRIDLLPLFPHEAKAVGSPVLVSGLTIYPPDMTQTTRLRLSRAGDSLFFDYLDTQGTPGTLVFTAGGWTFRQYGVGAGVHYQEEGINSALTLVGHTDGVVSYLANVLADRGFPFTCIVKTPADDQGESRARKQYGDLLFDYGGITSGSSAAGSGGTGGDLNLGSGTTSTGGGGIVFIGTDIGSVMIAGSTIQNTLNAYTVTGGTASDTGTYQGIDGNGQPHDGFHFANKGASGNTTIIGRYVTKSNNGLAGLMVRSDLTDAAINVFCGVEADGFFPNNVSVAQRLIANDTGDYPGTDSQVTIGGNAYPVWLKVVVSTFGNLVDCYWSTDGVTWTHVRQTAIALISSYRIGIAVAAGSPAETATVFFDNLSITNP